MGCLCLCYPHSSEYEASNDFSHLEDVLVLKTASHILIFHKFKPREHADLNSEVSEISKGFSKSSHTNEDLAPFSLNPWLPRNCDSPHQCPNSRYSQLNVLK